MWKSEYARGHESRRVIDLGCHGVGESLSPFAVPITVKSMCSIENQMFHSTYKIGTNEISTSSLTILYRQIFLVVCFHLENVDFI